MDGLGIDECKDIRLPSRTDVGTASNRGDLLNFGTCSSSGFAHSTATTKVMTMDDLFGPPSSTIENSLPDSVAHHTPQQNNSNIMNDVCNGTKASSALGWIASSAGSGNAESRTIHEGKPVGSTPHASVKPKACASKASFPLDVFFSNTSTSSASSPPPPTSVPLPSMIYVDGSNEENQNEKNGVDLMDLHPSNIETTKFQSAESYLDAFEKRRVSGHGRIGNSSSSLENLTRNRDGNKVKARLLPLLSHYDVLGVPRDALPETVKRKYRLLAMSLHPDKTVGIQRTAEEEDLFKAITTAYEVLSDDEKRQNYDEELLLKEGLER